MSPALIRFVPQSVTPLGPCPHDEDGLLKRVELCGRVAYKSEDKITADSALEFVRRMKEHGHFSVLEHSNVVLVEDHIKKGTDHLYERFRERGAFHKIVYGDANIAYVSGNLRAWIETIDYFVQAGREGLAGCYALLLAKYLPRVCDGYTRLIGKAPGGFWVMPTEEQVNYLKLDRRYDLPIFTFKVVCDRGISHELVRHRVMSFTQESTRYVNYEKRGITMILPEILERDWDEASGLLKPGMAMRADNFHSALGRVATQYEGEVSMGMKPQMARDLLPNLLKTELLISGRFSHWQHFVKLRESKAAHPRVQKIAAAIREHFEGLGLPMAH